jgi:hypothetical protein
VSGRTISWPPWHAMAPKDPAPVEIRAEGRTAKLWGHCWRRQGPLVARGLTVRMRRSYSFRRSTGDLVLSIRQVTICSKGASVKLAKHGTPRQGLSHASCRRWQPTGRSRPMCPARQAISRRHEQAGGTRRTSDALRRLPVCATVSHSSASLGDEHNRAVRGNPERPVSHNHLLIVSICATSLYTSLPQRGRANGPCE